MYILNDSKNLLFTRMDFENDSKLLGFLFLVFIEFNVGKIVLIQ